MIFFSAFTIQSGIAVKEFKNDSDLTNDKVAVVKCYATWCGYCTKFAPVYEKMAQEMPFNPRENL